MHLQNVVATLAVVGSLVSASPTPVEGKIGVTVSKKSGFHVGQVATGRKVKKHGAVQVMQTLKKYGAHVPDNVKAAAAAATQSGSVVATPEAYDEEYLCPVQIGTPAQTLMLDFDTGSADLWVFTGRLPTSERKGHSVYTIANSKTAKLESGETWDIDYGDGSGAKGIVYSDKVVIGPVTATSQAVECATSVSSEFVQDTANDGLVGLASSSINTVTPNPATTFFDTVKATLPSQLFTSYLKHGAPGAFGFGFLNSSEYTGSITYTPVSFANGFWEFDTTAYSVGNTTYTSKLDCIADTGTTLIYVPAAVLTNYYAKVTGATNSAAAGGYIFPCTSTLPNFSVTIGGTSYTVPGTYINYAPYSGDTCFGGLQSSAGVGFNILGDIFLKSVYAVFDEGNTRIGFATQA